MRRLASAFRLCFAWGRRSRSVGGRVALLEGGLAPSPTQTRVGLLANVFLTTLALCIVGLRRILRRA
ncbi:MAG: hypothetical protein Q7S25_00285 [Candidatus Limnocylindria bacterium]|nr:hypothetical protein [Candidatus Limnocylindria bacterium]